MDFAVTAKLFAEPANKLPVAPTVIGKTLKLLSVDLTGIPRAVNPFGKSRKAVPVTAKEIAASWKGKGEPPTQTAGLRRPLRGSEKRRD